jgi:hypothetical protein
MKMKRKETKRASEKKEKLNSFSVRLGTQFCQSIFMAHFFAAAAAAAEFEKE